VFGKRYSISRKLLFQPIVPVHVDLYLPGKPSLYFYADQPAFLIHEVEVNKQAFPTGGPYHGMSRYLLPGASGNGAARRLCILHYSAFRSYFFNE
jgi:hypothetical protein